MVFGIAKYKIVIYGIVESKVVLSKTVVCRIAILKVVVYESKITFSSKSYLSIFNKVVVSTWKRIVILAYIWL